MQLIDADARLHRATALLDNVVIGGAPAPHNGVRSVLVTLPSATPGQAQLELNFFNPHVLPAILTDIATGPAAGRATRIARIFPLRGGHRLRAGTGVGQVRVVDVLPGLNGTSLRLQVAPIGDYSTYTLQVEFARVDPFLSAIDFKFRPGCFTHPCACAPDHRAAPDQPIIDYLAKDYGSFRSTLMGAMQERVPGWAFSSEVDFDQVLIDLFSAAGDELSDFQDRVMNEAYLGTARKRVSVARHARFMDYHIHEGNQATTWVALTATAAFDLPDPFVVWTGEPRLAEGASVFAWMRERKHGKIVSPRRRVDPLLNAIRLHTWTGASLGLPAGSTGADLRFVLQADANRFAALVHETRLDQPHLRVLLLQEHRNPLTGSTTDADPEKRQLLHLLPGTAGAEVIADPVDGVWVVRVRWEPTDALRHTYCCAVHSIPQAPPPSACGPDPTQPVGHGPVDSDEIALFHGNLVPVAHGRPITVTFEEAGTDLPPDQDDPRILDPAGAKLYTPLAYFRHYERICRNRGPVAEDCACREGSPQSGALEPIAVRAALPVRPLAYRATPQGGDVPARSTARVEVAAPGVPRNDWDEVPSLVHSDTSDENGDHFVTETDELRWSMLRFGNNDNGRWLPDGATITVSCQVGDGLAGNIGSDSLVRWDAQDPALQFLDGCWNPFDVRDGRGPERIPEILRSAPEAYRARQLRAVTLADYITRAEEVPGVAKAVARYAWTGSWRTVRIAVDPAGTPDLSLELRRRVLGHLEAVRLIGEDIELRAALPVPLAVTVVLCVSPTHWIEDVRMALEDEFTDSYTGDGRRGFFHPDEWTFGQPIHKSQLAGRVHQVAGVEHLISIRLERYEQATLGTTDAEALDVRTEEIILVRNDPDHRELGFIDFVLHGGRQ